MVRLTAYQPSPVDNETSGLPRTVAEAVNALVRSLDRAEQDEIAVLSQGDLIDLHFGLGMRIRAVFGLWRGNRALLADCQRMKFMGRISLPEIPPIILMIHPDDASSVIIKALWDRLRH